MAPMTWARAKIAVAPIMVVRIGRRRVAMAMAGAPMVMPTAKPVTSSPAADRETCSSPAMFSSSPAIMNSLVPKAKMTAARSITTGGTRSFVGLSGVAALMPAPPGPA